MKAMLSNEEITYSQTRLIRPLLIRHFRLIRRDPLKSLSLTPMLNQPFSHTCQFVAKSPGIFATN